LLERSAKEGDSPVICHAAVQIKCFVKRRYFCVLGQLSIAKIIESNCLRVQFKVGGKFHLKLNMKERPIANKYCEGKMKRTLKKGLN